MYYLLTTDRLFQLKMMGACKLHADVCYRYFLIWFFARNYEIILWIIWWIGRYLDTYFCVSL